jgi:Flp pilus assembly protein TadD
VRARIAVYRAKLGRCGEARQSLLRALDLAQSDSTIQGWGALVYELCGERSTALTLLRQALQGGYPATDIEHDPWYAELRRSERYRDIILNNKPEAIGSRN